MKPDQRQPAPRVNLRGVQKYLNVVEAPQMANRRLVGLLATAVVAIVGQATAIMLMLPLKERVPYVIQVEEDASGRPTGRVTVADSGVAAFTPSEAHMRFFLARWAEDLLIMDETSRTVRLPASYALLKGQALADWNRYITDVAKPLEVLVNEPNYRQRAELISISFIGDGAAMIRVKLTNSKGMRSASRST